MEEEKQRGKSCCKVAWRRKNQKQIIWASRWADSRDRRKEDECTWDEHGSGLTWPGDREAEPRRGVWNARDLSWRHWHWPLVHTPSSSSGAQGLMIIQRKRGECGHYGADGWLSAPKNCVWIFFWRVFLLGTSLHLSLCQPVLDQGALRAAQAQQIGNI